MFDATLDDLPLHDILTRLQLAEIPTRANGVFYTGFPPEGFHDSRTALWFYCPFFLQAANQRIPVFNLHIPPEFAQRNEDFVHRAIDSRLVPTLGQLFQTFDAPMYIPTDVQNSLLAHIHSDFGQEMELLLAQFFMQFAPQQYWDRQTIPTPSESQI